MTFMLKKKKSKFIISKLNLILVSVFLIGFMIISPLLLNQFLVISQNNSLNIQTQMVNTNPKSSSNHTPIFINGNDWSSCDVVTGNGTFNDPYVIANLTIDAGGLDGIQIINSQAYAIIKNCTILNGKNGFS